MRRSFHYNFSPIGNAKLARAFNNTSGTSSFTSISTISSALTFVIILALFGDMYTNVNLQKAIKLALELFI